MSKVKMSTKDKDKRICLRNKDFYNSFNNIIMFKFNLMDFIIIMLFSYIMNVRNQAESELKKICTQFANRNYIILLTLIIYFTIIITNNFEIKNIMLSTLLFLSTNFVVIFYFNFNKVKLNDIFFKKYQIISENINIVLR